MLNESLFLLSFDELKILLSHQLNIFHIAVGYVLTYVVYKALGRYIYFKTQEHASKINRTFLTLSLLIIMLHMLNIVSTFLPFLPEYRWFYILNSLILLIALLSIITYRIVWNYQHGYKRSRDWHYDYLPVSNDYYKTSIHKSERDGGSLHSWEEEGVESTSENVHSDVMLNILALLVFGSVCVKWAIDSSINFDKFSYFYGITIGIFVTLLFIDRTMFSWILYLEKNYKELFRIK